MQAYLDNSATTRCSEGVRDIVVKVMMEDFGNPSSRHDKGMEAEKYLREARMDIAATLKADEKEIYFTSGGTESDNWALIGTAMANKRAGKHIITTAIEHAAVIQPMIYLQEQGFEVSYIPVDRYGRIDLQKFSDAIREDTILVSTMYVNNEIGTLEPIEEIGKIIKEKNTIAVINKNQLYAYGDEAYAMYEKAPENINVSFPVTGGVIADYNNMQTMVQELLEKNVKGHVKGSEFIIAVPTDITEVEKKAFYDLFFKSKMKPKSVLLCDKPIADAVGLGLDVNEPTGIMIVDIGADTTEISVLSLGGLVLSDLLHFGGNRLDESIITYIKKNFNLVIGQKTAMQLKEHIGSALPGEEGSYTIVGLDVVSGLPIEMEITAETVYEAMKDNLNSICNAIKMILEKTPPELAKDIIHSGIYLTGGGSNIKDMDRLFTDITNIKVNTCEEPDETVVRGLSLVVTNDKFKRLSYSMRTKIFK